MTERLLRHEGDLHAPHLLDVEVAGAIRRRVSAGELAASVGRAILSDLVELRLRRYPHVVLLERMWQLRRSLPSYDAVYVALAEALDAALVTTDQALARAGGHRARIEVFPG